MVDALRLVAELKPHQKNYNRHNDRQIADLAESLQRFGQRKPVVTWGNIIVAGHGLVLAAKKLGWSEVTTAPVPSEWGEMQVLAYLAADNELARHADPDLAQLAEIAKELQGIDAQLARLAAGSERALNELIERLAVKGGDTEPQIDKAEELRQKWCVELGQLWQLGEHRIICGDCTDRAVVERVMSGEKADAVVTDPPYGIGVDKSMHKNSGKRYGRAAAPNNYYAATDWDNEPPNGQTIDYLRGLASDVVLFGGNYFELPPARCYLVWDKQNDGVQFADCELAWTNLDKPVRLIRHLWNGMLRKGKEERLSHPTQKPVAVISWAIEQCNNPQIILDTYLGSGTTLIACQNLSRKCRAVEISPAYVAVAIERWATHTGGIPVLL